MRIRDGRTDDLDFIVASNIALAFETEDVTLDPALIRPGVATALADPGLGRYLVAEEDGRPIGQLMVTTEWSDWRNGLFLWIQSVYVSPAHRGAGVFRTLYRHLESEARRDPRVCGIRLYVDHSNGRAQEVYARLGMHRSEYAIMQDVFRGPEAPDR